MKIKKLRLFEGNLHFKIEGVFYTCDAAISFNSTNADGNRTINIHRLKIFNQKYNYVLTAHVQARKVFEQELKVFLDNNDLECLTLSS